MMSSKEKVKKIKESDNSEYVQRKCDPCKTEDIERDADGYCKVCKEYLCGKCEGFHRKFQATRSHKIVHGVLMPKPVKKFMTTCENHPNNPVSFFCKSHGDVLCNECKEKKHDSCNFVMPVEIFSSREIEKEDIDAVKTEIETIKTHFTDILASRKNDLEDLQMQQKNCTNIIDTIRNDFNMLLDKLENDLRTSFEMKYLSEENFVRDQVSTCERAIEHLVTVSNDIKNVQKTEDKLATFTTYTRANKAITGYTDVLKDVKNESYSAQFSITPNPNVTEAMEKLTSLGDTSLSVIPTTFKNKLSQLKRENIRVVETKVHSVRMPGDDKDHDCEVTGSVFLDDGSLVICDKHNYKVKLMTPKFECKFDVKLTGSPWDVAIVNDNWIIATLPFAKKLQFLHVDVNEGFRMGRFIQTEKMCWGVAVSKDDIIISCHDNPGNGKVHILDKRGHVKKILGAEAEDTPYLLDLPFYIAVNEGGDRIYVADGDLKRTITCITKKNGNIIYDYSACEFGYSKASNAKAFQNPWSFKILVDEDEYIYANLGEKEMIQVVTDAGTRYKALLNNKTELFGPHAMAYRECDSTLIIGLWDQIQTFRFKEIDFPLSD